MTADIDRSQPVAYIEFTHGKMHPVYEDCDGRQYVLDGRGQRVFGIWYIPPEDVDRPVIVDDREF